MGAFCWEALDVPYTAFAAARHVASSGSGTTLRKPPSSSQTQRRPTGPGADAGSGAAAFITPKPGRAPLARAINSRRASAVNTNVKPERPVPRPSIGVMFSCCNVYVRGYLNVANKFYARCPRCLVALYFDRADGASRSSGRAPPVKP